MQAARTRPFCKICWRNSVLSSGIARRLQRLKGGPIQTIGAHVPIFRKRVSICWRLDGGCLGQSGTVLLKPRIRSSCPSFIRLATPFTGQETSGQCRRQTHALVGRGLKRPATLFASVHGVFRRTSKGVYQDDNPRFKSAPPPHSINISSLATHNWTSLIITLSAKK